MKKLFILLGMGAIVVSLLVFSGYSAFSAIPHLINYQGMLTQSDGKTPVTNGNYDLTFKIYGSSGGVDSLWTEHRLGVTVTNGLFNVILGDVTTLNLAFNADYWLGIKVGTDPELSPRIRLTSVGYAYRAEKADTADYARGGGGGTGSPWVFRLTDGNDTTITTGGRWGIARYGNTLYGNADSTHVNLGVACTTGTSGQNWKYCMVGGGISNTAGRDYSVVGGGRSNTASGVSATVAGGEYNSGSGWYSTIGGGFSNRANADYATVGGGINDTASGYEATVGGGGYNTASGILATIGGGQHNRATNSYATLGGGLNNTASGQYTTITGGYYNAASNNYATVGGGYTDTARGDYATVGGGYHNIARGWAATVGGGDDNTANGYTATVGGGWANAADTEYATVGGGLVNTASGWAATVGGGQYNAASGSLSTIPGGAFDTVAGECSFATGNLVKIAIGADYTFAFGRQFTTSTPNAVIFHNSVDPIKVGIGTSDPQNTLHIKGYNPRIIIEAATSNPEINFKSSGDPNSEVWALYKDTASNDLRFYQWGNKVTFQNSTGNVGIGTTAPGYKLDVAGEAHASSFPTSSDARLKKNVTQLTNVLDKLEKIRGVSFEWNELYESMGRSTGHREIGVIAQEVEAEFPELVTTWGEEKYRAVDYGRLTGVLIEAIKEQQKELKEQRSEIELLKAKIEVLRTNNR